MMARAGKYNQVNSISYDEFARPNGIILVDKPAGVTSHDIVDRTRRELGLRKVGHAGALDVFSSGLLLILVGKATKLSDELLVKDKAYEARVIFGVETTTQDPEGEIVKVDEALELDQLAIERALASFAGGYEQYVSLFSSVKVEGKKLRKILRDPNWEYSVNETPERKVLTLLSKHDPSKSYSLEIPKRAIKIFMIQLLDFGRIEATALPFPSLKESGHSFFYADIFVSCSKGTYIRQLAEDIGKKMGTIAALSSLRRTELGEWTLRDAIKVEDIGSFRRS